LELVSFSIPKSSERLVIAPLGDFQWSGEHGPTAQDTLKRHIDACLKLDAFFFGMGDYIDFLSPSNRRRLMSADLYDTAKEVVAAKALELTEEVFEKFLKPTVGRWIGLLEGHHFFECDGQTTDQTLADKLKCKFLGTSAFVRIPNADLTIYGHHGVGSGILPGVGLNKLYHVASGLQGADVYLMGHNTKLATTPLSRPFPVWDKKPYLNHKNVYFVNTGGFSKSNMVGHRSGTIARGDYAEQKMMTPSPLSAPIITVRIKEDWPHRLSVTV
jgi:hypothetical protein